MLSDSRFQENPVDQVHNYLQTGFEFAENLGGNLREQFMVRLLNQLIEQASESLNDQLMKQRCLDNIYRLMVKLRALYRDRPDGQRRLNQLTYQLNTLYHYCSGRC